MKLKIIPVIDILSGVAVHAVRGKREEYQPLKSVLCASSKPVDVAFAYKARGFKELYIADLDAILGKGKNSSVLKLYFVSAFFIFMSVKIFHSFKEFVRFF